MIPKVDSAHWITDFRLHIRFTNGTEGEVDLRNELNGDVFEVLKDVNYFKRFQVHPEFHTLTWPNGADFAPEFLYERVRVTA